MSSLASSACVDREMPRGSCVQRSRGCVGSSEIAPMDDTCGRFDALIARAPQLTAEQAAELEAHLAGCRSCRDLARAMKPVDSHAAFADESVDSDSVGGAQINIELDAAAEIAATVVVAGHFLQRLF